VQKLSIEVSQAEKVLVKKTKLKNSTVLLFATVG
jgi:hypothetical protein